MEFNPWNTLADVLKRRKFSSFVGKCSPKISIALWQKALKARPLLGFTPDTLWL